MVFSSGAPGFSPDPIAEPFAKGYAVQVWRHSCGSLQPRLSIWNLMATKVEPLLKSLHNDPLYAALLKKLNLPN
jgi:hypothetical protein